MKFQLFTIAFAALTLFSCGVNQNKSMSANSDQVEITNTKWVLETLEGQKVDAFQNGKEISFTLDTEENRIHGFSGCNSFFGIYNLEEGNRIRFSALGATRMACPEGAINENDFLEIFNLADNYTINGDKLELNVGKRAPLAVFKKAKTSAEPIVEKYWKLKKLDGKDIKMVKNQEKEIYFMLKTDDNRVTGFAGCNTILGSYKLEEGNRIRFSNMGSTMMACPDVDFNEADFLKIFQIADNYTIDGDTLKLNVGRRAPLAVFEAVYFN